MSRRQRRPGDRPSRSRLRHPGGPQPDPDSDGSDAAASPPAARAGPPDSPRPPPAAAGRPRNCRCGAAPAQEPQPGIEPGPPRDRTSRPKPGGRRHAGKGRGARARDCAQGWPAVAQRRALGAAGDGAERMAAAWATAAACPAAAYAAADSHCRHVKRPDCSAGLRPPSRRAVANAKDQPSTAHATATTAAAPSRPDSCCAARPRRLAIYIVGHQPGRSQPETPSEGDLLPRRRCPRHADSPRPTLPTPHAARWRQPSSLPSPRHAWLHSTAQSTKHLCSQDDACLPPCQARYCLSPPMKPQPDMSPQGDCLPPCQARYCRLRPPLRRT